MYEIAAVIETFPYIIKKNQLYYLYSIDEFIFYSIFHLFESNNKIKP